MLKAQFYLRLLVSENKGTTIVKRGYVPIHTAW